MGAGKAHRLGRIFGADGRTLVLPVDHGLVLGRVEGLEDPVARVDGLLDLPCDGLLMAPGLTRHTADRFAHRGAPARLLTLDTFFREPGETAAGAGLAADVELAVRLGVDAVKLFMAWNVPSGERAATVARIGEVVARAEAYDMPVMVEPIGIDAPRDESTIALEGDAARVAMESGADIVKVAYPGAEAMSAWAAELRVPLVILGGPRSGEADAVLELAREALAHGARGLVIGRNVWQRPPEVTRRLMGDLHEIVHQPSARAASSREG